MVKVKQHKRNINIHSQVKLKVVHRKLGDANVILTKASDILNTQVTKFTQQRIDNLIVDIRKLRADIATILDLSE